MRIKAAIEKVPGGLMIVPLMLGALLNTIDQMHLPVVQDLLRWLGAPATAKGHYEFFRIGGFTEALFKNGALTLIAMFLLCAASQMNLRVGGVALKKGALLTLSKYLVGLAVGFLSGKFFDSFEGLLGLSTVAIIAAMTNSNGGMFVALTGQYGNRSDVGAIGVLSLNDGPFLTLVGLGLMGAHFPVIVFLAVLIPIAAGMALGNLDPEIRQFLAPGERLTIPFFALALGTGMDLAVFFHSDVLLGGLTLGLMTTVLTGFAGMLVLKLFRERSQIAGWAEGSTAGNAIGTPAAVMLAAEAAAKAGKMPPEIATKYKDILETATAQVSISTLTTAILCPVAVILWNRYQLSKGIDGTSDAV